MGNVVPFKTIADLEEITRQHPCFNKEANYKYGRIHLPVSPECNIKCKFCVRTFNRRENRPGVAGGILTPQKALTILDKALDLCPDISVAGIAGPGDTLATEHAVETFELVHEKYPHLINCLSTNGLLLNDYAERLVKAGVKTITVTVNAVDPEILTQICDRVTLNRVTMTGRDAAVMLIMSQLAGIKKAVSLGAAVKINTVLVPGVNDGHIGEIAKTVAKWGATLYNIIPLIPQGDFAGIEPPNCLDLNEAREAAEQYITVFRHCRHCRADACGIPGKGEDLSYLLYGGEKIEDTFSHG